MFNLLLKSGLSLALLSSPTISSSGSCFSVMQVHSPVLSADSYCCPPDTSPDQHPTSPVSSDDCRCGVKQVIATSKNHFPVPVTGISAHYDSSSQTPSGRNRVQTPCHSLANSRPLYLLHCVWIC